jgi:hypothetical protein
MVLSANGDYILSINQLIFLMVTCCVLFVVRIESLKNSLTNFGFKGLLLGLLRRKLTNVIST